jgi:hypothetical protein
MAPIGISSKLNSKILETAHKLSRGCIRGLAVVAIVASYGFGHAVSVIGISGIAMTASTTDAQAWRGGRGWGRGWGRGGGWCYWHPRACRGW